ncbi:hypothetical protein PS862_00563 [Pseudomonas fluorescens]|uniref:Uncharacterized protein n=1 Tax=Pseudomonas fluorescens TaxID=294 RepID=A0A5E7GWG7_PSEFL|nr:hypothetical protein [Pseudomonas fluorescens]VVO56035.1 hypothetical protein PS862_00563 [Pseudomonas fluorescens]
MDKDIALSVAGNLSSISAGLAEVWREGVINSLLFARLYADSNVERFAQPQQWYKYHAEAMSKSKWEVGSHRFSSFEPGENSSFVLKHLIQGRFGFDSAQAKQYERLMYCIQQDSAAEVIASSAGGHALVYQSEGQTSTVSTIALQVSLVVRGPALYTGFVYFKTGQAVSNNLFIQEFKSELVLGEVIIGVTKLVLNKASYERARMREKILASLPEVTAPLVLDLTPECDAHCSS